VSPTAPQEGVLFLLVTTYFPLQPPRPSYLEEASLELGCCFFVVPPGVAVPPSLLRPANSLVPPQLPLHCPLPFATIARCAPPLRVEPFLIFRFTLTPKPPVAFLTFGCATGLTINRPPPHDMSICPVLELFTFSVPTVGGQVTPPVEIRPQCSYREPVSYCCVRLPFLSALQMMRKPQITRTQLLDTFLLPPLNFSLLPEWGKKREFGSNIPNLPPPPYSHRVFAPVTVFRCKSSTISQRASFLTFFFVFLLRTRLVIICFFLPSSPFLTMANLPAYFPKRSSSDPATKTPCRTSSQFFSRASVSTSAPERRFFLCPFC